MKTAIVTGASKGIGRQIALTLSENGFNVVADYNTSYTEALSLKDEIISKGGSCEIFKADVSVYEEAEKLFDFCIRKYGRLDVLVNNAGISHIGLLTDTSKAEWQKIINTNLGSVYNTSHAVVPYMVKQKEGKIINISSVWGVVGASCEVAYSASKAGVIGFTYALAKELAPSNIQVNCISPGVIMTDMMKSFSESDLEAIKSDIPADRLGKPRDVADAVLFLANDTNSYIIGQNINVGGGFGM